MKQILFILSLFSLPVWGTGLVREDYEGVRPLGMGNAFLALSDDANILFYNPAALARVKGPHVNLFDYTLGVDSTDTLNRVTNSIFSGDYSNLINTSSPEMLKFTGQANFIFPYFGFGLYSKTFSFSDLGSLNSLLSGNVSGLANIDIDSYSDLGAIAGLGLPIGDNLSIGATVRGFYRQGIDENTDPASLLTQLGVTPQALQATPYTYLKGLLASGFAFGANAGLLYQVPLADKNSTTRLQLAAEVQDISGTVFRQVSGNPAPNPIPMSYHLGSALIYNVQRDATINLTMDFRHLFEGLPLIRSFHFGAEYRKKHYGLRIGAYQGWPTAGVSIEALPHTRVHFTTYAVELGDNAYQRSARFYVLQLSIGFNPL
jgi:hypothetical protein